MESGSKQNRISQDKGISFPDTASRVEIYESLAYDLATALLSKDEILNKYDISEPQLLDKLKHPAFKEMVSSAKREWFRAESGATRVKIKARMAQEVVLGDLVKIARDPSAKEADRIAAAKEIRNSSDSYDDSLRIKQEAAKELLNRGFGEPMKVNIFLTSDSGAEATVKKTVLDGEVVRDLEPEVSQDRVSQDPSDPEHK